MTTPTRYGQGAYGSGAYGSTPTPVVVDVELSAASLDQLEAELRLRDLPHPADLLHPCPYCQQPAGQECRTASGAPAPIHTARHR